MIGYLLDDFFEGLFSRPGAVSVFLLVTAAILAISERWGRRERDLDSLNWLDATAVGFAQAGAIIPGISRSGATIAAGLARGLRRLPSARFSFLLGTPIVLGAGLLQLVDLFATGERVALGPSLIAGFRAAFGVGYGCIGFLMRHHQRGRR